jgi:hypothetical protein
MGREVLVVPECFEYPGSLSARALAVAVHKTPFLTTWVLPAILDANLLASPLLTRSSKYQPLTFLLCTVLFSHRASSPHSTTPSSVSVSNTLAKSIPC